MSTVGTAWRDTSLSGDVMSRNDNDVDVDDDDDYRIKEGNVSNLACPTDKCQSQILPPQVIWLFIMLIMLSLMMILKNDARRCRSW